MRSGVRFPQLPRAYLFLTAVDLKHPARLGYGRSEVRLPELPSDLSVSTLFFANKSMLLSSAVWCRANASERQPQSSCVCLHSPNQHFMHLRAVCSQHSMSGDSAQSWLSGSVLSNLPYTDDANDPDRQLDLYMPTNAPLARPPILLVYVHGGLWMDRDKKEYQHVGRHYATQGLTTAVVNYRRTQHKAATAATDAGTETMPAVEEDMSLVIRHPTHTLDVAAALTFLTSDASLQHVPADAYDRRRVVVFGHSCGAHMLALLLSHPTFHLPPTIRSSLIGCVGCEGLYAVAQYAAAHPDWSADLYRVFPSFDDPVSQPQLLTGHVPWLVLHSKDDVWVERRQAEVWQQWVSDRGGRVQVVDVTGGHFEVVERIGSDSDCISPHLLPWIEQLKR